MPVVDEINVPYFLSEQFQAGEFINVDINDVFVGLKRAHLNKTKYTSIYLTPHYCFMKVFLRNKESPLLLNHDYKKYSEDNVEASSPEEFTALARNIENKGYMYAENPIYVFKHWSRPFPFRRLDVADGFHRLAILAALGQHKVIVCRLKYKHSLLTRFLHRVLQK